MITNKIVTPFTFIVLLFISAYAIYSDLSSIHKKVTNIKIVSTKFNQILTFKTIIEELQRERGLTNIYYSHKNKETLEVLQKQNKRLSQLIKKNRPLEETVFKLRQNIKNEIFTKEEILQKYTTTIFAMLFETKKLLFYTDNYQIKNHFFLFQKMNYIQEYLGQLRAIIGSILAQKKISKEEYIRVVKLSSLVENYIQQTKDNLKFETIRLQSPLSKEYFIKTDSIIQAIIQEKLSTIDSSSLEWFTISSASIDSVASQISYFLEEVQKEIQKKQIDIQQKEIQHIIFWLIAGVISILLAILLYKTNKQMLVKQKLLNDYKKAIDNSTIVSKTDKHGVITYVNEAFCKISGYTEAELIGKPHNIVRDPNVDKKIFKNLWRTIKDGKTWTGMIVNHTKNKSQYWVEASVSPIFDDANNLVEYIAIRHDVTEMVELHNEIRNTQHELIYRMSESVESRSKESGNHIKRVAHYSKLLAQYCGLTSAETEIIFIASAMHDIGKIATPDSILLKPAKLTEDEYKIMKTHAYTGYKILSGSNLPILKVAADIAHQHHERYDGKGYPNAFKEDEISIYAKIVAIADVFDALISDRVYKKAWPLEKVLKLFREESGKQFDPRIMQLFLNNIDKFMEIKNKFED